MFAFGTDKRSSESTIAFTLWVNMSLFFNNACKNYQLLLLTYKVLILFEQAYKTSETFKVKLAVKKFHNMSKQT